MIFVTVGSQLPFDRLVMAVDKWSEGNKEQDIFAQIGQSDYSPANFKFCASMPPSEYNYFFDKASLIISHVGMGTIISALEGNKHLLLLPRLAGLGEVRNDHQLATAKYFSNYTNITLVNNEGELLSAIDFLVNHKSLVEKKISMPPVSDTLIEAIKEYANS